MTITIETHDLRPDARLNQYVEATIGGLEKYLARVDRKSAHATVTLARVDRPHNNKYEATVELTAGGRTLHATDSTLNIYAALDIVRRKLALGLAGRPDGLPKGTKRV